jgi:hypothetical protein
MVVGRSESGFRLVGDIEADCSTWGQDTGVGAQFSLCQGKSKNLAQCLELFPLRPKIHMYSKRYCGPCSNEKYPPPVLHRMSQRLSAFNWCFFSYICTPMILAWSQSPAPCRSSCTWPFYGGMHHVQCCLPWCPENRTNRAAWWIKHASRPPAPAKPIHCVTWWE